MMGKTLLVLFGIVMLAINVIATLLSFNITSSFLGFMPTAMMIYSIASAVLSIVMIVVGVSPHTM
jgi:hypothetical protein